MPYHNLLYCVFLLEFLLVDLLSSFVVELENYMILSVFLMSLKLDLLGHLVGIFDMEIRIKLIEKLLDDYLQALVLIQYQ
ncbi:hypothetical protein DOZ91_06600 [Peribacillus frigoritolerans]|nr:hypothetical protein DOZ91_06600 [Peribacillus frigoritolerans]